MQHWCTAESCRIGFLMDQNTGQGYGCVKELHSPLRIVGSCVNRTLQHAHRSYPTEAKWGHFAWPNKPAVRASSSWDAPILTFELGTLGGQHILGGESSRSDFGLSEGPIIPSPGAGRTPTPRPERRGSRSTVRTPRYTLYARVETRAPSFRRVYTRVTALLSCTTSTLQT